MILYRPVGLQELELIYDGGMKVFPARLSQQPIFYPVLDLEYARQIASDWNVKNGQYAGYVTQFKVEDSYIDQFEKHTVGGSQHQEFWIPAEEMEEFNRHIVGHIKVVEAHFGEPFQGFVPETFGLQGKNAVEQFTLLANDYIYKRMDFYLEIKRNHKAVFLNYPFWLKYDFKNQGLKEKILEAIKGAWLTSFPKIPLPSPVPAEVTSGVQTDSKALAESVHEDTRLLEQADSHSSVQRIQEEAPPVNYIVPVPVARPAHTETLPSKRADSYLTDGVKLGQSGNYDGAIEALSTAVEQNPHDAVARASLGVAFHRAGEDDRALSCYETALKIDPKWAEAHYFRANILYGRGNVREAIAGFTKAIGLKPELIEAHDQAIPQDRLTDYSRSPLEIYRIARSAHRILELNKTLESDPGQAYLFKERAAEYYRLGNYEQAIADYNSSLAIEPDDASALHYRGLAYEQIGQIERASEDYEQAVSINPQLSDAYVNRGVAFGKMGNLRQSLASLTEGIRLSPMNTDSYFNRGMTYVQLGDFENAIADFSVVIQLSSNDDAAYYWRGISNEGAGRQNEAISDYRQFLALSQDAHARQEIEQKLRQWNVRKRSNGEDRGADADERHQTNQAPSDRPIPQLDLYGLLTALGERALNSTWFGSSVDCHGEAAEELFAYTEQDRPIQGRELLRIASGILQTFEGDFQAFDPDADSYWILMRAWHGTGFFVETSDPMVKETLEARFESVEEVEGAQPPYEAFFIRS